MDYPCLMMTVQKGDNIMKVSICKCWVNDNLYGGWYYSFNPNGSDYFEIVDIELPEKFILGEDMINNKAIYYQHEDGMTEHATIIAKTRYNEAEATPVLICASCVINLKIIGA